MDRLRDMQHCFNDDQQRQWENGDFIIIIM